jgi:hypothetical protein
MPDLGKIKNQDDLVREPTVEKRLLNPVDRISEVLFGLIMALTFTCTISVAEADRTEVRDMLVGAIGCNIAWGLVDAVMFILTMLAEKGHGRTILNFIRKTSEDEKARTFIGDALPPIVTSVLQKEDLENIRKGLLKIPKSNLKIRITKNDIKISMGIFLLVFLSTFPVALPFAFIHNVQRALRTSNLVAIILMFICGWLLAKYGGYNKLLMGFTMTLLGIILVAITIALGG